MGGLGNSHVHPYAVQTAAFLASLLLPGFALFLVGGAYLERFRRLNPRRRTNRQVTSRVALAPELSAD
jgi:hypothetical protein